MSTLNKLEELILSIFILILIIILNLGYAFSGSNLSVDGHGYDAISLYTSIQKELLDNGSSTSSIDWNNVYIVLTLNDSPIYVYGNSELTNSSEPVIFPILINGSLGEMRCWLREGD